MLRWIYRKLVDGKIVCDECRDGKSETRVFSGRCWETGGQVKTCEDDMVGFAIVGRLGRTPRAHGAGDSATGSILRWDIAVGAGLPRIHAIGKRKQREMQALVEQFDCRWSSDSVGAD